MMSTATSTPVADGTGVNGHSVGAVPMVREVQRTPEASRMDAMVAPPATNSAPAPAKTVSKRVQRWAEQLAEDSAMLDIQGQAALVEADTDKVIVERRKAAEAYKLHQLASDPARAALSDARVRRAVGIIGGSFLVGALVWSTAGVQVTVAGSATPAEPVWWMAFLVEPIVSSVVLLVFGVRAWIAAKKGVTIVDSKLRRCEAIALAITLTCNSWLYLPGVAPHFSVIALLVHSIGPLVAIMLVTVIPTLWHYLSIDWSGENTTSGDDVFGEHMKLARQLIADQVLPVTPSRAAFERTLRTALKEQGKRGINTAAAQRVWRALIGKAGPPVP